METSEVIYVLLLIAVIYALWKNSEKVMSIISNDVSDEIGSKANDKAKVVYVVQDDTYYPGSIVSPYYPDYSYYPSYGGGYYPSYGGGGRRGGSRRRRGGGRRRGRMGGGHRRTGGRRNLGRGGVKRSPVTIKHQHASPPKRK